MCSACRWSNALLPLRSESTDANVRCVRPPLLIHDERGGGGWRGVSKHTSHPLAGALKRRRQPLLLRRASFIICCCSAVCAPYCLLCWGTAGFVQTDERKILLFTRLRAVNNLSKASAKHKKSGGGGTRYFALTIQEAIKGTLSAEKPTPASPL